MRVLVAAERLGPGGGMERSLDVVLPALVARGARVHAIARRIDAVPPGVTAETVSWSDEHDPPASAARAAAERAFAAFGPDLTIAHNVMDAGILGVLRGAARYAYHVHDHRPFCPNGDRVYPRGKANCTAALGNACLVHALVHGCAYGPRPRSVALVHRRERLRDAIASADAVIVASAYVADRAIESGVPRSRIVTIPPPLPDAAYAAAPRRSASRSVVFAGRIVPQKGLDALVRAVAALPAADRPLIRAFGEGPALTAARRDAERLGVTLDAPGFATPETLRTAMDEAALVAVPSRWAEPFGYVGIEAFARGRTVAAFASGGIDAWLRDDDNGVAVALGDDAALGRAIRRVIDDGPYRDRLAASARAGAERFRLGPVVDALWAAYGSR